MKVRIDRARKYYEQFSDEATPFITIMFDGWDGRRSKNHGVSMSWIDPLDWELNKVGTG